MRIYWNKEDNSLEIVQEQERKKPFEIRKGIKRKHKLL